MLEIDKLCYTSGLRYMNAGEKCFFSLASVILCVAGRSIPVSLTVLFTTTILTTWKGHLSITRWLRYLALPLGFLFLSALTILVNVSKTPLDAFALSVGSFYLTGSLEGIRLGIRLIVTALASVSCLYFLSFSTPVTDLLAVLEVCHIPRTVIELMMLMYRFIFLLLETASLMVLSQDSRLGNRNFQTAIRSKGLLISTLFIRAIGQAEALFDSMEARCYNGRIRVLKEAHPPRPKEIAAILLYETFLISLILLL